VGEYPGKVLRYYNGIFLEGLRKTAKHFIQISRHIMEAFELISSHAFNHISTDSLKCQT
jgi:hypothetical protein